jgi:hypothetical protein
MSEKGKKEQLSGKIRFTKIYTRVMGRPRQTQLLKNK